METYLPAIPSRTERFVMAGLLIGLVLALLAGALTIPFAFESPSILYKFGIDKTLLRIGKLLGLAATVLLLVQLLLAARLKLLDRVFGLPRAAYFHRINGLLIALLALLHPVFILWPEGFILPPLKLEYWPEAAGALLVLLICLQAGISLARRKLHIAHNRWQRTHGYVGGAILLLLVLHILFVSETFEGGLPRYALLATVAVFLAGFALAKFKARGSAENTWRIDAVIPENSAVTTLRLTPATASGWRYLPGQFAFVSVLSAHLPREAHPFTLSSAPTRPDRLAVSIKASGDWTAGVRRLQTGDTVILDGPFGLFSHLVCPRRQALIFIAGGIGITPMLSMLRYLHATGDPRPVLLLWSNKTRADLVFEEELAGYERELTGFTMVPTFTREPSGEFNPGRLDRPTLQGLLGNADRSAAVFICGPSRMMKAVARDIRALGFDRKAIYTERFGF